MATPTTGTPSGFDATVFRDAIKFAMQMGSPNKTSEKITFRWRTSHTYTQEDIIDRPYDWTSNPVTTDSHADVIVDCAVEFLRTTGNASETNPVGTFDATRATITILDVDYTPVRGADQVLIGGDLYDIMYVQPLALFDVDVYQLHCVAVDET